MSDAQAKIADLVGKSDVLLFMKGTPLFPQCGFSSRAVAILNHCNVEFDSVDVLQDPEVRNGIKEFSDWPTIPQLYVKGEFVGGSDIMMEMYEAGELQDMLTSKGVASAGVKPPEGTSAMLMERNAARSATDGCDGRDTDGERPLVICDLTQSYSPAGGGGISTYLREKRGHVLRETPHTLVQIVPGPADRVIVNGRHIFAEVGAKRVPGSPNYRFILRTRAVRDLLARYRPDVVESLCPWVLPWTAINHRRAFPETALVAGYRTDFPNAHIHRVANDLFGVRTANGLRRLSYGYARRTYRAFDWVYTLGEDNRTILGEHGIIRTSVLPLGVDTAMFTPNMRDPKLRAKLGLAGQGPLLIYAGRIDNEKRADRLIAMFKLLPHELGAAMVMIGDGKLRPGLEKQAAGLPIAFTGFEHSRGELARALASSDIYVSAMADETFGISVLEAQAAGLPVIGVASGAMPDRVPAGLGLLGPVDDVQAMADNVVALWKQDCAAVGRTARMHVERTYSWSATFSQLFGEIYPRALAQARYRTGAILAAKGWVAARDRISQRSDPRR